MKRRLQLKLILVFFVITLISGICSISIVLLVFSGKREQRHIMNQERLAKTIQKLDAETEYSTEKILEMCSYDEYHVEIIEDSAPYEKYMERLRQGDIINIVSGRWRKQRTVFSNGNVIFEITYIHSRNADTEILTVLGAGFLISLSLGTIITAFISKIILEPIRELIQATKEVAGGNFKTRVSEKRGLEFKDLARNFNKMTQELDGIESLRNDFISNVSHEFKTPIASIQGFAKLLQTDSISVEERKEYTDIIIEETNRLSKLSSNILKLSKLENQSIFIEKRCFNLEEQIRRCILILEPEWDKKNIELQIDLEEIIYVGYEELLNQVWINLISNAIKFSKENSEISIVMNSSDNWAVVTITDYGCGISEDKITHIFDKFFQVDKSRSNEGNGLGLALAKKIVDLSEGIITVNSTLGIGSTFQIKLPRRS